MTSTIDKEKVKKCMDILEARFDFNRYIENDRYFITAHSRNGRVVVELIFKNKIIRKYVTLSDIQELKENHVVSLFTNNDLEDCIYR